MTIIKLEASNVKRLRAVTITPQGSAVLIGGRNAQGKSSVLDAIAYALAGKDAIPTEPIRRGEKSASIVLETQEIVVTRKFTAKGSTLEVTNKDGMVFPSPQAVLDKLCSKVAFDPLAFVRLGESVAGRREQLRQLRDLVGVDTSKLDAERATVFAKRTEVNRQVAAQHAVFSALPSTGPAPVDVKGLLGQMQDMEAKNAQADQLLRAAEEAERKAMSGEARLRQAVEAVKRIEAELAKAKKRIKPKYRRRPTVRRRKRTAKDFIADINCTLNRIEVLIEHYIELQLEVSKHIVGEQFVLLQRKDNPTEPGSGFDSNAGNDLGSKGLPY